MSLFIRRGSRRALLLFSAWAGFTLLAVAPDLVSRAAVAPRQPAFRILLYTRTTGFRHDSIPAAIAAIRQLGRDNGFDVEQTEDQSRFTDEGLAPYAAVVFLMTTGDVLSDTQQAAFERYIRSGKGYVGIHSASDTEYDWPWYGGLIGAYFLNHPPGTSRATIRVENRSHPSTSMLPDPWVRTDEWYNFRSNPRGTVQVLATLDESSYNPGPGAMGADHPIAWFHAYDGGRAWYTAGGHTASSYSEPLFVQHILGGIRYATGVAGPDGATATATSTSATAATTTATTTSAPTSATPGTTATAATTVPTSPVPGRPRVWLPFLRR
jgi:cytochrome c